MELYSSFGLHQLVNESTLTHHNCSTSIIDLVFGSTPELVTHSAVTRSLCKQMPVHHQANYIDCVVYSIAYAYHAALGDELTTLHFDSKKMMKHLFDCFTAEEISPFPVKQGQPPIQCAERDIYIPLYCTCSLPKSYDEKMIQCDVLRVVSL